MGDTAWKAATWKTKTVGKVILKSVLDKYTVKKVSAGSGLCPQTTTTTSSSSSSSSSSVCLSLRTKQLFAYIGHLKILFLASPMSSSSLYRFIILYFFQAPLFTVYYLHGLTMFIYHFLLNFNIDLTFSRISAALPTFFLVNVYVQFIVFGVSFPTVLVSLLCLVILCIHHNLITSPLLPLKYCFRCGLYLC